MPGEAGQPPPQNRTLGLRAGASHGVLMDFHGGLICFNGSSWDSTGSKTIDNGDSNPHSTLGFDMF